MDTTKPSSRWDKAKKYNLDPFEALFVAVIDQALIDAMDENPVTSETAREWLSTVAIDFVGLANISPVEFERGLIDQGVLTTDEIRFYRERVQIS